MVFVYAEVNRVRRAGDTMQGSLDFDTHAASFGGLNITGDATDLIIKKGAIIAAKLGDGVLNLAPLNDGTQNGELYLYQDTNAGSPNGYGYSRLTCSNLGRGLSLNLSDEAGSTYGALNAASEAADPFVIWNARKIGDVPLGGLQWWKNGSGVTITNGAAIPIIGLTDGVLDISATTANGSELLLKYYDQTLIPALDTNGDTAVWENDSNVLQLVGRDSTGITRAFETGRPVISVQFVKNGGTPYVKSNAAVYQVVGHLIYPGTTRMAATAFRAAVTMTGGAATGSVKLYDATNGNTIAEVIGVFGAVKTLQSDLSLTNLPAAAAIFEIQVKTDSGDIRIHSVEVE